MSRHNIRSPLTNGDSLLKKVTNHEWFKWTSKASELSLRGEKLEELMGQYYRKYLIDKDFINDNWLPKDNEVRVYANSKQRTFTTAKHFIKGLFPNTNIEVEQRMKMGEMDPTFELATSFVSDEYISQIHKEIKENIDMSSLKNKFELLEEVLDYDESQMAKDLPHLDPKDYILGIEKGKVLSLSGSINIACSAADALKLQYYEDEDNYRAAFNHDLSVHQWLDICEIVDIFCDMLHAMPSVSKNVGNAMLKEVYSELSNPSRKLTFLCGHDSNIINFLNSLDVEEYSCPKTYERKTPMGGAILIEKWKEIDTNEEYYSICLTYQTLYQLEEMPTLELDKAPVRYHLSFKGLEQNKDGLYKTKDFENRILQGISEHEEILKKFNK